MKTLKLAIILSLLACVEMWPRGAPNTTCVSMMPGHGKSQQSGQSPYTLTLSKKTYKPNERIQLTLSGSTTFKGFLIKPTIYIPTQSGIGLPGTIPARSQSDNSAPTVGTLATSPEAKNNCPLPSLTHTNNNTKESLTFTWKAPSSDQGQIVFRYTVVQSKDVYWVNLASDPISYSPESSSSQVKPSVIAMLFSFLTRVFKRWV